SPLVLINQHRIGGIAAITPAHWICVCLPIRASSGGLFSCVHLTVRRLRQKVAGNGQVLCSMLLLCLIILGVWPIRERGRAASRLMTFPRIPLTHLLGDVTIL